MELLPLIYQVAMQVYAYKNGRQEKINYEESKTHHKLILQLAESNFSRT